MINIYEFMTQTSLLCYRGNDIISSFIGGGKNKIKYLVFQALL